MKFSREIEIQKQKKVAEADFPEKFLFALGKMGRNVLKWPQNWFAFEIYNILPLLFAESSIKWNKLPHALIQSDCWILWRSIYLELMGQFLCFFAWRCSPKKSNMLGFCFWMSVSRHDHLWPELSRISRSSFAQTWGCIPGKKIIQNEILSHRMKGVLVQYDYRILWLSVFLDGNKALDFLHRDSNQEQIVCKISTTGWVWPGVPSHDQTCVDIPGLNMVGLRLVWSN